jgi:DNA-directed RNA polymerase specialized sigma24 family protein
VQTAGGTQDGLAAALAEDRAWLVRLCARLAGDVVVAEDLAQEVLLEAWRHAHTLTEPSGRPAWMAAIARNVYLRWGSARGRRAAREVPLGPDETASDVRDDTDLVGGSRSPPRAVAPPCPAPSSAARTC